MNEGSLVYSVVVNYESYDDTRDCLDSLIDQEYSNHRIVVVINDNRYQKASDLREEYPRCKFILTDENLGFSRGFNVGIRFALNNGADYVSILNNDVVLESDFVKNSVRAFSEHDNVGMIGGKIYKHDAGRTNTLWAAGGQMSWLRTKGVPRGFDEHDDGQYDEVDEVGFVPGAQLFVKRSVFEDVGLLPEAYFLGGEEWEFSLRIRRAGYRILYVPDVVLWHKVGHSAERGYSRYYNYYRNKLLFTRRNIPLTIWVLWFVAFVAYLHSVFWWRFREMEPTMMYRAAIAAMSDHARADGLWIRKDDFESAQKKEKKMSGKDYE